MANRYWIGNSGSWNQTSHWSTTDGGAGGASYPRTSDNAYFTANSFTTKSTVTFVSIYNVALVSFVGLTQEVILKLSSNLTVTSLVINGKEPTIERLSIISSTAGTKKNITVNAANVVASSVNFLDINFVNAVDLSNIGGGSQNLGNCSGITFTPSANLYFKHFGGGNVEFNNSSKWFTDIARTIPGRVPLLQDYAIYDADSFDAATTLQMKTEYMSPFDMSAITQPLTISITASFSINFYGDFVLSDNVTGILGGNYAIRHIATGTFHIYNLFNKPITVAINFNGGASGGYIVHSDINSTKSITLTTGTLDFNDHDVRCSSLYCPGGTLNMGNGTIYTAMASPSQHAIEFLSATINVEQSRVVIAPVDPGAKSSIRLNGKSLNILEYPTPTAHYLGMSGPGSTINHLILGAGVKVVFEYGGGLSWNFGNITIGVSNGLLTKIEGYDYKPELRYTGPESFLQFQNLSVYNTYALPSTKLWYAGRGSVNRGLNTLWIFDDRDPAIYRIGMDIMRLT